MIKLKKNKTIIIGESGSGKSYTALNIALKKKGTTFICNGCVSKSYYEKSFPSLKEYEDKDGAYNFIPQRNGKYYIYKSLRQFVPDSEFLHAWGVITDILEMIEMQLLCSMTMRG